MWIVPILSWIAAAIALYSSKPNVKYFAHISVFITFILAFCQSYDAYNQFKSKKIVDRYAYSRIENLSRKIIYLIRSINFESTDGWIPNNDDDFFSLKTAKNICVNLNVEKNAPVIPSQNWISWIDVNIKQANNEISDILSLYSANLDSELIKYLIEFKSSFLLTYTQQRAAWFFYEKSMGIESMPPVFCYGFESKMEDSLSNLRKLYEISNRYTKNRHFLYDNGEYKGSISISRYSNEDLENWLNKHPNYKIYIGEKAPF